jgi:hypothetical protein
MFVKEFLVSPIFYEGGGLPAFRWARKRANRLFGSGDWGGRPEQSRRPMAPSTRF